MRVRKGGSPPLLIFFSFFILNFICTGQTLPRADLVIVNAKVRTMTTERSTADAIAVSGARIVAVGSKTAIGKRIGPATRVIDARGRLLLPGFNDSHVHFMGIGNMFSTFDLRPLTSPAEVEVELARYVRFLPKGRWMLGSGWKDAIAPARNRIDELTPDNPVLIYHPDGRSAFANAAALRAAKLTTAIANRDASGLVHDETMRRIAAVVPKDHTRNWREIAETATNFAASLGVTSVQDMHSDDSRATYRDLERSGKLKTRVYDCLPLRVGKKVHDSDLPRDDTAMVRGGCLKGFSDGDAESASRLASDIAAADRAGWQVMIHAIGNSANAIVLDALERTINDNGPRDRRSRIEHAHNVRPTDLPRFARSGIIASMQPNLFYGGTGGYYATLLGSNARLAFGSDAAITDLDPMLGIFAAVSAEGESVSVYEAVRAYTVGSAYSEFQDREKGTIEAGKLADFVILSDDIFSVAPSRLRQVKVVMTVVGGRVVYLNDDGK